jgi:hypothetical protein
MFRDAAHVRVDLRCIRPVLLHRHEIEARFLDQVHRALGRHRTRLPDERLKPGRGRDDVGDRQASQFQFGIDPEATDDVRRSTNAIYAIDEEHVVPVEW